jgi:hypothetical protein
MATTTAAAGFIVREPAGRPASTFTPLEIEAYVGAPTTASSATTTVGALALAVANLAADITRAFETTPSTAAATATAGAVPGTVAGFTATVALPIETTTSTAAAVWLRLCSA